MRSGQFEIFFEGSHCYFTDWYDSGFATFAVNAEEFVFKIDVADFQISGFRNAQTACVHHFKMVRLRWVRGSLAEFGKTLSSRSTS